MRAVIGLGNPEPVHTATRHNLGFWLIERLLRARRWKVRTHAWGEVAARPDAVLLRPYTYMNRSGDAVVRFVRRYSLRVRDLLVAYDDADLPLGTVRLLPKGGPGTHNGMRSVLAALATHEVPRLRVGLGRPPEGTDLAEYVLRPPEKDEIPSLLRAVDLAAELALVFLDTGTEGALDHYARLNLPL